MTSDMKTVIIGLDAYDPNVFERLYQNSKLPNLGSVLNEGGYSRFQVTNPPQSEVSWTSIATGLNPGEHGIFDFVHRDPGTYGLQVSLLPKAKYLGSSVFIRPSNAQTIFDIAAERGFPSTSLWWPATFPAKPESPVRTLPGLGTPDVQGRLGVGAFFSSETGLPAKMGKTPVRFLREKGTSRFIGEIEGPQINKNSEIKNTLLPFEAFVKDDHHVDVMIGNQLMNLKLGQWSPIIELRFKASWLASVHSVTRMIIVGIKPHLKIYFLPLQIHPIRPLWRYGTPASFVKDAWLSSGPFLTLGWPQDTTGLEDGCITDDQFLDLCDSIFKARSSLLFHLLDNFQEGLLASVFDSLDRIQHMFFHRRQDVVDSWYIKLDHLVGEVIRKLKSNSDRSFNLLVVSDHGFNRWNHKIHLNRWLMEKGYLYPLEDKNSNDWKSIDWSRTKAYAIGLNSLYFNLSGRERNGIVQLADLDTNIHKLKADLAAWKTPENQPVVSNSWQNKQVFQGQYASDGPDMVIGYSPGCRASAETGLGGWGISAIESNQDHWEADHCYDAASVPGVIFSINGLQDFPNPSYRDIPALSINAAPEAGRNQPPRKKFLENQDEIEDRLKSLGYL